MWSVSRLSSCGLRPLTVACRCLRVTGVARGRRMYTETHEWATVDAGVATIGITDHAQKELGDIVYVELPEVGTKLAAGGPCGSVESVKATSEVSSPCDGVVSEVNPALADSPDLVNKSPFDEGWMIKVKEAALDKSLLDEDAYEKLCATE